MAAALDNLPTELLLLIASFCNCSRGYPSLYTSPHPYLRSLTLVSRRLHVVFDRMLWELDQNTGAVFWAVCRNRIDVLEKAFKYELPLGSAERPSPIHEAAMINNSTTISWLLDHGVPVDGHAEEVLTSQSPDRDFVDVKFSPLYTALRAKKQTAAITLLSRNARYRFKGDRPFHFEVFIQSALHFAAYNDLHEVVKYLVETKGADVDEIIEFEFGTSLLPRTPLQMATRSHRGDHTIRTLLSLGADINAELRSDLCPPLTLAIQEANFYLAQLLLRFGAKVNPTNKDALSPLMACIRYYSPFRTSSPYFEGIFRSIIKKGADLDQPYNGDTPLTAAIGHRFPTLLFYRLLKAGADVHKPRERDGQTPIELIRSSISAGNDLSGMACLLAAAGARLDTPDPNGRDFFHHFITNCEYFHPVIMGTACDDDSNFSKYIRLAERHNTHTGTEFLDELLEDCLDNQELDKVTTLIRHGATSPKAKELAFRWAQQTVGTHSELDRDHDQVLINCLDLGLDNYQLESLFLDALYGVNIKHCHIIIARGVLSFKNASRPFWLHIAAAGGWTLLVRRLHKHGMDINELDEKLGTPLMRALEAGHTEVVRVLIELGADPFHPRPYETCRRGHNPSTEIISPFELALRRNYMRFVRRWWLDSEPEDRPTEEFHIPCVLARGPRSRSYMESLRRLADEDPTDIQDGEDQEYDIKEEESEKLSKLHDALAFIKNGGLGPCQSDQEFFMESGDEGNDRQLLEAS
ncbi:ankyrin [Hypoxylon rubiginosum]|uniref:Ankyrin n=1 Tax=Hypoxylon rubiginosum TaxID=110542 RepID=A0ACB9ZE62_9PEZI|nr:ankyrin [Hypoxylon rubiginosum]